MGMLMIIETMVIVIVMVMTMSIVTLAKLAQVAV
jgi:hypothetical protein